MSARDKHSGGGVRESQSGDPSPATPLGGVHHKPNRGTQKIETLSHMMQKLGIPDLPALVKFAVQHGLTPLE